MVRFPPTTLIAPPLEAELLENVELSIQVTDFLVEDEITLLEESLKMQFETFKLPVVDMAKLMKVTFLRVMEVDESNPKP